MAGSFLPEQLEGRSEALSKLEFLVVQELFENETTAAADVVLPASSYAEQDGTFTNNDGLVQRVRQSIPPLHQSKPDWMIIAQLAKELGLDFGYEMSASAVFRAIADSVPRLFRNALSVTERRNKPDSGEIPGWTKRCDGGDRGRSQSRLNHFRMMARR